jgi:TetR/AcrR family transcriptional repressor of mexJK operon
MSHASEAATRPGKVSRDLRRKNILEIARAAFISQGYGGTSMSQIAVGLGGSKATLYSYFHSKEDLFAAVLEKKSGDAPVIIIDADEQDGNFRNDLLRIAMKLVLFLLDDDNIATFRLITAESARFPELASGFYFGGWHNSRLMLAKHFRHAQHAGRLGGGDPELMASCFLDLSRGELWLRKLWNVSSNPSEGEFRVAAEQTVSQFLAIYGVRP